MSRTAIVTGASSGIGKAITWKLAEEGINVILASRNEGRLAELEKEINESKVGKARFIVTDVSNREQVENMVEEVIAHFGSIDYLINNAGVMLNAVVTEGKVEEWEEMIDTNIKGVLYGTNAVLPYMLKQKTGHIINIASVSGFEISKRSTVYSATKFAVRAISTGLEKELAHTGVRVTNISPGMVDTNLTSRMNMTRKPLEPEDIANAVFYAISQPPYVNVNEITVRPV